MRCARSGGRCSASSSRPRRASVCSGTGQIDAEPVRDLPGRRAPATARARSTSKCPAASTTGQRLRLAGRGPAAPRGGPAGDLYVAVRVAPHPDFERRGDDLWRTLPVSIAQAALGTRARARDARRRRRSSRCRPGTQHGTLLRLARSGRAVVAQRPARRSRGRGRVDVPTHLTAEEAELLAAVRGDARRDGDPAARRAVLPDSLGLQDVNAGGPPGTDAVAHVFVEALDDRCVIAGDDGHHLRRARRLTRGRARHRGRRHGRLAALRDQRTPGGRHRAWPTRADARYEPAPHVGVALAVALTKGGLDHVVAAAPSSVSPASRRCVPSAAWRVGTRARAEKAAARLRAVAREAAMQCRRVRVPAVDAVTALDEVAAASRRRRRRPDRDAPRSRWNLRARASGPWSSDPRAGSRAAEQRVARGPRARARGRRRTCCGRRRPPSRSWPSSPSGSLTAAL